MNPLDEHREALDQVQALLPSRCEGQPVFQMPWHARVFALMVVMVKDQKLEWKTFQTRLVEELKSVQRPDAQLTPDEVDQQYFDCWLRAAEATLQSQAFVGPQDIERQIQTIRKTVASIREAQLKTSN